MKLNSKKKLMEVELKMAPSLRWPLDGQGVRRILEMTQAPKSRQSLNGQGVHKIPEKLTAKRPNTGLDIRVRSWNLGRISGRGMEVCEQLRRRKVDMCYLQKVRWRGQGTRFIKVKGRRYKFWWSEINDGTGEVGIMV